MTAAALLAELEGLTHNGRVRRMLEIGRASKADAAARDVLAELSRGETYPRFLALQAVYGSGDGASALRFAGDPSGLVRRGALRLVARFGSDDQALDALRAAAPRDRLGLIRHLARLGRSAPVDAILDDLVARRDPAADRLLPYGSSRAVARHLDAARKRGGYVLWTRLARRHPEITALVVGSWAASDPPEPDADDPRRLAEANTALNALSRDRPTAAAPIAFALARRFPVGKLALGNLVKTRPAVVADLLLASPDTANVDLRPVAHRLDDARLRALLAAGRIRGMTGEDASGASLLFGVSFSLRRLPPARRAALFRDFRAAWSDEHGLVHTFTLSMLPADVRQVEARRGLAHPARAARPDDLMAYAGLLPWDEARAALGPWLGHPEPERRAAALKALAGCVRFDRGRMADLLELALARKNEPDPVRSALLDGLDGLPPSCVKAEHLDALGRVARQALDAADLSRGTVGTLQHIVLRQLPRHPDWAAGWMETFAREQGEVFVAGLDGFLANADAARLAAAVAPVLAVWQSREREGPLLQFAQCLGRRLRAVPPLLDALERLARDSRTPYVASAALALLARHDPARHASLVPALLADDPSWATQPGVYTFLHRHRQDLLTPFLGRRAYSGRFSSGKTRFVLPLASGFQRWTASQQAAFAKTLGEVVDPRDRNRDIPSVVFASRQLAALAFVPPDRVVALTSDTRPAVAEAALRGLGRLDTDAGVPVLLEALGDDRARVAVYALRKALLTMPPAHALGLLRTAPLKRVTVAKEVLRLAGEFPGDDAFAFLQEAATRPLHRDVRVALLRAYWSHLDRPEAWAALEAASSESDPALVSGAVRIPADGLDPAARRRLSALLERLLSHPDANVRVAVLNRLWTSPGADPEGRLGSRALGLLRSPVPEEREQAAYAAVSLLAAADAPTVAAGVSDLLNPADRRALAELVNLLTHWVPTDRARYGPLARAALGALAADPRTGTHQAGLAVATFAGPELAAAFEAQAAAGALHPDALAAALAALSTAASWPGGASLDDLESSLSSHPDDRLRRLALGALLARVESLGWDEPRRARLDGYRRDPAPLVADLALRTFPPEEIP